MALNNVWLIPFLAFFFSVAAFIVSYAIAVYYGHVDAFFPYISDTGSFEPESCVFSQFLNLAALCMAISVYLRHRQIIEFYWHACGQKGVYRRISKAFLIIGWISSLGISIVANFQQMKPPSLYVHYTGALVAFTFGLVYAWGQTMFSYNLTPRLHSLILYHLRLLLTLISTGAYCTGLIFFSLGRAPPIEDHERLYHWTGKEKNYREHMISIFSEWTIALCFQVYLLSFAAELQHTYVHAPKLKLRRPKTSEIIPVNIGITSISVDRF